VANIMRKFLAIPLPEEVKNNIESITEPFQVIKGLKFVRPENLHLTLSFLGDTETESRMGALRAITFQPFTLMTTFVKLFPEEKPRLIWIELENSEELLELYHKIASVFGIHKDFKAHLTLGRIKWLSPAEKRFIEEEIELFNPCKMGIPVNSFNLYNSELRPEGPLYKLIESFPAS
jgi:RNA 2',3'-cyclic 3'-phosphodiesterase